MSYKKMMEQARKDSVTSEKTMWQSIDHVDGLLAVMATEHPEMVKDFMRKQHELLYGPHYNEAMAMEDVKDIHYTDRDGKARHGAYWTVDEVEDATRGMTFPSGTTKYDKYVAFNVFRSDTCKKLEDAEVLQAAYAFFFADEDYQGDGKIWNYMSCLR